MKKPKQKPTKPPRPGKPYAGLDAAHRMFAEVIRRLTQHAPTEAST